MAQVSIRFDPSWLKLAQGGATGEEKMFGNNDPAQARIEIERTEA